MVSGERGRGAGTRERLLDATERIIRARGIQAVTTKDIAREAGYAEATLYRHFQDKTELLLTVMAERISGHFLELIHELPGRAGAGDVAATLEEFVDAAVAFFGQTMPLNVALAADPALLAEHYRRLRALDAGPEVARRSVAAYIAAEQRLDRVRAEASPDAVAAILLGVSHNYAEMRHTAGSEAVILPPERFAGEVVATLMVGLRRKSANSGIPRGA